MEEYLILLTERESPEGRIGDFFGKGNKRREAPLSDLSALFESYSKNSMLVGWGKEKQARLYYGLKRISFPNAKLIKVDVLSKPATMEIIDEH